MSSHFRISSLVLFLFSFAAAVVSPSTRAADLSQERQWRRPIALALVEQRLYVANWMSGTVSIIEPTRRKVLQEVTIGKRLSDLKPIPDSQFLLALDEEQHQLILVSRLQTDLQVVQRLSVPSYPVSIDVAPDGSQCSIASLWSRRISVIDLTPLRQTTEPRIRRLTIKNVIDLSFAPRAQMRLRGTGQLIVADAFAGQLAVVDPERGQVLAVRSLSGHNIRGLCEDHRRGVLLVTHQRLQPKASTSNDLVQWGGVISNVIRAVSIQELVRTSEQDRTIGGVQYPLGTPDEAAGDPLEIKITQQGQLLVGLAGVRQIGVGTKLGQHLTRIDVGHRPTAIACDRDDRFAYVANSLDESISVIDLASKTNAGEIPLGPHPDLGPEELGERHFYDARISLGGWFSCHSCHTDGQPQPTRGSRDLSSARIQRPVRCVVLEQWRRHVS